MMNANTRPENQKQIMNSSGLFTCTFMNSMFPNPKSVVCMSESSATTPKRPK